MLVKEKKARRKRTLIKVMGCWPDISGQNVTATKLDLTLLCHTIRQFIAIIAIMPVTVSQILVPYKYRPELVERVSPRIVQPPITIVEPRAEWPQRFKEVEEGVRKALGTLILDISHYGSTSVPGLPAKDIIDVDLTLKDATDEASYVKPLEEAGFRFIVREPQWHQHRFFAESGSMGYHVNLHVWGPDSPEVARHRIFRDWLLKTPADLELYAKVKREAAEWTTETGGSMQVYNQRKERVIQEILNRSFRDLGYIE
jgi:GrpB-like predicted nucleotidyltransferase (UPF0157 family)